MALSRQDRAFYEEKLSWKSLLTLFGLTIGIGIVLWPALFYVQDWSAGQTSGWTLQHALGLAFNGAMFGMVVSALMYLLFRFFLWMGWLPARR
ncbi:MAG: hypothetical protein LV479_06365 [Methylacidiphilales bacterium]|nr:hypothetical protein [Candidatus Methylacidiphilales bacterium]